MSKITSTPLDIWQLCDRFLLSIWVSRVRWQDVASGRPLTQQCASYPRLTDLKLNLQGLCALLEFLPEGCHGQQLYFSLYVNLLMWLHQQCTDSPCNTTHCDAGLVATLELCAQQTSRVCIHQRWQIPPAGRKKISLCMLVHSIYGGAWHILLLMYEHPHHITSTKQDIFTSLYPT